MDPDCNVESQPAALANRRCVVARRGCPEPRGLPDSRPLRPCSRCRCHCHPGGERTARRGARLPASRLRPPFLGALRRAVQRHLQRVRGTQGGVRSSGEARSRGPRARLRLALPASLGRGPHGPSRRPEASVAQRPPQVEVLQQESEESRSRACRTLARQVEPLEAWIDARWREGVPFVVLGDFNREIDRHGERDHLWTSIADDDPPGLELHRLSAGRNPACWRGTSRHFRYPIDLFVFDSRAWQRVDAASFRQIVWTDSDADPRRGLPSDHCPIAVDLF